MAAQHMDLSNFFIVAVISNPMRYGSRWRLYEQFKEDIERKGAHLITVELQTGKRVHKITEPANVDHIQLWHTGLDGIIWNKESMQNVGVNHMTREYPGWRYVCFIDADVRVDKNFIEECQHKLQLHPVIQPWSQCADYAPDGGAVSEKMQMSYAYCNWFGIDVKGGSAYAAGGHPGYAICMRREFYNQVGGLIDIGIAGSGDRHQITGIVGKIHESYHDNVSDGYKRWLHQWQDRAVRYGKKNLGYLPHILRHSFHGSKKNRFYGSRWKILTTWKFDPYTDLKKDSSGLWQLVVEDDRQIGLRDALYKYFASRQEDANSL